MKNFLQKQREIITIFAYMGVVAMLVTFIVFPLLSRTSGINDKIQEENLKQEIARQQVSELPKMQQQYEMLQDESNSVDVLLDENNVVPLIEKLEKLAQDSGNKIQITVQDVLTEEKQNKTKAQDQATPKKKPEDGIANALPDPDYLQIKITLTGNFNSIMNFISVLESFEYYSDITGVQIKQNEESTIQDSNAEFSNPFSARSNNAKKEKIGDADEGALEASLDVVFYTK